MKTPALIIRKATITVSQTPAATGVSHFWWGIYREWVLQAYRRLYHILTVSVFWVLLTPESSSTCSLKNLSYYSHKTTFPSSSKWFFWSTDSMQSASVAIWGGNQEHPQVIHSLQKMTWGSVLIALPASFSLTFAIFMAFALFSFWGTPSWQNCTSSSLNLRFLKFLKFLNHFVLHFLYQIPVQSQMLRPHTQRFTRSQAHVWSWFFSIFYLAKNSLSFLH